MAKSVGHVISTETAVSSDTWDELSTELNSLDDPMTDASELYSRATAHPEASSVYQWLIG